MKSTWMLLAVSAVAIVCGCADEKDIAFFPPEGQESVTRTLNIQAENGAAADATLYAIHFDGTALNALGRAKLEMILSAGREVPIDTIYVDCRGATATACQKSVREYLASSGGTGIKVEPGCDPRAVHCVAGDLQRMSKAESGTMPAGGNANGAPTPATPDMPSSPTPLK